jgi:hypothetical protein
MREEETNKTTGEFILMTILLLLVIFLFGVALSVSYDAGQDNGREYENKRIYNCYMAKDFSGFAWVDDSKYFTCSADIRKGKVYYTREK